MLWSLIQKWDCTAMTRAVERDYVEVVEMIQRVTGETPPEKWCAFRRSRGAARWGLLTVWLVAQVLVSSEG